MANIDATGPIEKAGDTKRGRRLLFLLLKIIVSVSLLGYLVTKLDFSSLTKLQSDIVWYVAISSVVMLVALGFMTVRWKFVLALIEMKNYSLRLLYDFYLVGSFFNIFIPGAIGGDAMRLYYVSKAYHLTKTKSLLSVFIERIAGLFALGLILMFSLLFNDTIRSKLDFGFTLIVLSTAGMVLALVIAKYFIQRKMAVGYKEMAIILLLSGLGQFGDILIAYIYALYFDLDISVLNLMSIMPLVYIATVIPISLGGVGVREGVMTAGMALYGIDVSDAVLVSFLLYLTKILIGLGGWIVYMKSGERKISMETIDA
ncbi:lysylphosphatidylglycerol synthase transmembrane domain-containing protein [Hydrogenimonas sp.]